MGGAVEDVLCDGVTEIVGVPHSGRTAAALALAGGRRLLYVSPGLLRHRELPRDAHVLRVESVAELCVFAARRLCAAVRLLRIQCVIIDDVEIFMAGEARPWRVADRLGRLVKTLRALCFVHGVWVIVVTACRQEPLCVLDGCAVLSELGFWWCYAANTRYMVRREGNGLCLIKLRSPRGDGPVRYSLRVDGRGVCVGEVQGDMLVEGET